MKHLDNLKLLALLMTVLPLGVWALPFVPTTDPMLSTNYWYFLKTEGYYCVGTSNFEIEFMSSANANNDNYLWCFVNVANEGYRLYNKGTGSYIQHEGLLFDNTYSYTHYEDKDGTNFYLKCYIPGWNVTQYLFMNIFQDQYGSMRYMDVDADKKGVFSVELAKEGTPLPADPQWTRFDADGVGYGYLDGGLGFNANESSNNLCDNNASTKYYGAVHKCWFTMKSSTDVAVKQYSIVTANDSWGQYKRALRSWKLQGSNDNSTWVDIDVQTDYPMPFADQQEVVFRVNDTRKFRFFKFAAYNGDNGGVQLSEVWINEQSHTWASEANRNTSPSCGMPGLDIRECTQCHARRWEKVPANLEHIYNDGVCTVCGINEGEFVLLSNGQWTPYMLKAYRGFRADSAGVTYWSQPPRGWNRSVDFDDSQWMDVAMPTASVDHSGGPYVSLRYTSYWYGEYNSLAFRRKFSLSELNSGDIFTFRCVHDDNMVVYVNGNEVINVEGWTTTPDDCTWLNSRESFKIPASYFQPGENVLAIFMQQNWGGAYFDCELTVLPGNVVMGDVNGDGKVDVEDVNAVINIILKTKTVTDYSGQADVNSDGKVDVEDVNAVINIILKVATS